MLLQIRILCKGYQTGIDSKLELSGNNLFWFYQYVSYYSKFHLHNSYYSV